MKSLRWRVFMYALAMAIVVPTGATMLPDAKQPACIRAMAWVRSHPTSLPTNLSELMAFPATWRKTILGRLPAETKATIQREHLAMTLGRTHLTPEQADLIARANELLTAEAYRDDGPKRRALHALERDFMDKFSKTDLERFGHLGSASIPRWTAESRLAAIGETIRNQFIVRAGGGAGVVCSCNCDSSFDAFKCWQITGGACGCYPLECEDPGNCGFWTISSCNGVCEDPLN